MSSKALQGTVVRKVCVDDITIDPRVQRAVRPRWVAHLASKFNAAAVGTPLLSQREDGTLVVLDGQHRVMAMKSLGLGHRQINAEIATGLSLADEAAVFRERNDFKRPRAIDDFEKGLVAEDPECVEIAEIAQRHGWTIGEQHQDTMVKAVDALRAIYRGKAHGDAHGRDVLDRTLATVTAAWGKDADAVNGQVLRGVALLFQSYNGEVDAAALARKLGSYNGGARGVAATAKALKDTVGGSTPRAVATVTVATYNKGRSTGKLKGFA